MVNGEICIGLFALRNVKKVCLQPSLTTFMCVCVCIVNSTRSCSFWCGSLLLLLFKLWLWKFEIVTSIYFLVSMSVVYYDLWLSNMWENVNLLNFVLPSMKMVSYAVFSLQMKYKNIRPFEPEMLNWTEGWMINVYSSFFLLVDLCC